jgi:MraZ protein
VFKGTYRHRIDPKGRVPVPAAFRRALEAEGESRLVVTALDQCLAGYSPREWAALEERLRALPAFSRPVKALTRLLTSRAADCELDVQGRILLPGPLREWAGLRHEAVMVGVLERIEVWTPEAWAGFVSEAERLLDGASLDIRWPLGAEAGPASGKARPSASSRPQAKPKR